MESIGLNVYEFKQGNEKTLYRMVYLSKIDDVIYILALRLRAKLSAQRIAALNSVTLVNALRFSSKRPPGT